MAMYRIIVFVVIITSSLIAGNAFCDDWKYYGEFTTTPEVKKVLFYNSNSIINTNNSIKLWVKVVLYRDLNKILENKLIVEKAAGKKAAGYIPPITKIKPKITNAVDLEEAANDLHVKSNAEILYQIVCSENKYRKISGVAANQNGVLNQPLGIGKWDEIEPDSNAENLAKIVCPLK
jgi:hypothetical protein